MSQQDPSANPPAPAHPSPTLEYAIPGSPVSIKPRWLLDIGIGLLIRFVMLPGLGMLFPISTAAQELPLYRGMRNLLIHANFFEIRCAVRVVPPPPGLCVLTLAICGMLVSAAAYGIGLMAAIRSCKALWRKSRRAPVVRTIMGIALVASAISCSSPSSDSPTVAPDRKSTSDLVIAMINWRPKPGDPLDAPNPYAPEVIRRGSEAVPVLLAELRPGQERHTDAWVIGALGAIGDSRAFVLLSECYARAPRGMTAISVGACMADHQVSALYERLKDDPEKLRQLLRTIYGPDLWKRVRDLPLPQLKMDTEKYAEEIRTRCRLLAWPAPG